MVTRLSVLVVAGAAGTLCRYGLAGLVQSGLGAVALYAGLTASRLI